MRPLEATSSTLGPFAARQRLLTARGELFLASGPAGDAVVRRLPGLDPHEVLDEVLEGVRFEHPHLVRVVDAGLSPDGVAWVAREDIPDALPEGLVWSELRERIREVLGALGAIDAQGLAHGRLHRGNVRCRDGRAVVVDGSGKGSASADLRELGGWLERPTDAPAAYHAWLDSLSQGRFDRPVDASRALSAVDPAPAKPAPVRPPVGVGLLALRTAPLRGRDVERQAIDQAIQQGRSQGRVVIVSGGAGMGSSRLVHASAGRAHRRGLATVFRGRRVSELVPEGAGSAELRRRLVDGKGPPAARYAQLRHALIDASGARTPVVVLDDAHHQPEHLLFAHHWLARRSPGVVLLDVDSVELERPRLARAIAALEAAGAIHLRLGPVSDDDLAASMLHLVPGEDDLARSAAMVGDGNPLAAHLALLTLVRTGEVPLDHSPWASWLGLVLSHDDDLRMLEVAAMLDDPIDPAEWMSAGTTLGLRWSRQLPVWLRLHGIARRSHGRWRLAHASLRDLLRQRCRDGGRWADVHRACAASVRGPGAAERRGRHLLEAGDTDGAADALLAGADADDPDALAEVLGLLAEALDRAPEADPRRVQLGLARLRVTDGESALAVAKDVAKHGTTEDRFRVAVHMVGALRQAPHDEQDTWVARAFALARKLGRDDAMGLAWQGLASVRLARGDLAGAERALSRANGFLVDPSAAVFRAELLTGLGRVDEAGPVLAAVDPDDNDALASRLQSAWGHRAYGAEHFPRALLHYRAAERLAERVGHAGEETAWHVAKALVRLERYADAQPRLLELARVRGPVAVAGTVGLLVSAARTGDRPSALRSVEWLADHAELVPDPAVPGLLAWAAERVDDGLAQQIRAVGARVGGAG